MNTSKKSRLINYNWLNAYSDNIFLTPFRYRLDGVFILIGVNTLQIDKMPFHAINANFKRY